MVNYQAMGNRMKFKRQAKKMSQEDMAKAIQISMSFYGNIERGRRVPSIETLVAIANALDVSVDYLLADSLKAKKAPRSQEENQVLVRFFRQQIAELDFGDVLPDKP